MKKKILVTILTCIIALSSLTGCSLLKTKPTSESLFNDFTSTIENADDMEMTFNMNLGFKTSSQDKSVDMNIKSEQEIDYQKTEDGYIMYAETSLRSEVLDETMEENAEGYIISEDNEIITYEKTDDKDYWTKSSKNIFFEDLMKNIENDFILSEELIDYNNQKCYLLTETLSSQDIPYFSETLDEQDLAFGEDVQILVNLYMNAKTKQPVAITYEMDLDKVNSLVADATEANEYSIEFTAFDFEIELDSINTGIEINIPDEVFEATEENTEEIIDDITEEVTTESLEGQTTEQTTEETTIVNSTGITEDPIVTKSLESLKAMGYDVNDNLTENHYFALITNNKSIATSLSIDMIFYKDGQKVENAVAYLEFEPNTFQIADFYMPSVEYDEVVFNIQEDTCYNSLIGSEIDVYYNIDLEESKVYGNIENNTTKTISYPTIHIVLLDSNGKVVGYEYSYADDQEVVPGASSNYDFYFDCEDTFDTYIVFCNAETNE